MKLRTWSGSIIDTHDYGLRVIVHWAVGWLRFWFRR